MKRKQMMAFLLSGILTFGTVSPVLAADGPVTEPQLTTADLKDKDQSVHSEKKESAPIGTAAPEGTEGKETVKDASATAAKKDNEVLTQLDNETKSDAAKGSDAAVNVTEGSTAADNAAEGSTSNDSAVNSDAANDTTAKDDSVKDNAAAQNNVQELVSDQELQVMSSSLTLRAQQLADTYNAMSAEEKAKINEIAGTSINVPNEIAHLKSLVTFQKLKTIVNSTSTPEEADNVLTQYEDAYISYIQNLSGILHDAKMFVSDYNKYLKEGMAAITKQLQTIVVKDYRLYTDEYVKQAKAYLDKVVKLKPGVQSNQEFIKLHAEISQFLGTGNQHLNKAILEDGIRASAAFQAFVNCAPDPAIAQTKFNYGAGITLTYGQVSAIVSQKAQSLLALYNAGNLTYDDLSSYYDNFYANLSNAYDSVSAAILKSVSDQIADAVYVGYTGSEKDAYEAALKEYNSIFASRNYAALPDAVTKLGNAASAYTDAANAHSIAEGRKQVPELINRLTAIKADIDSYREYYNDTYPAEVDAMIRQLNSADLDQMTGRQVFDLVNAANGVIDKQNSSYSGKMTDMIANAKKLAANANEWWAFLSDSMKGQAPYADAIALTNSLTDALNSINGVEQFVKAYDTFMNDYNSPGGKLQTAAKSVAQYILQHAEEVYSKESNNKHTKEMLDALKAAIDELKTSISAWDFDGTRAAAKKVKSAETALLKDKPVDSVAKETPKTEQKAAVTGDFATGMAGAGALALFSLTSITGVLGLKRKR